MPDLIHQFIQAGASRAPDAPALHYKAQTCTYGQLNEDIARVAGGLAALGLSAGERVAVYLPKLPETVQAIFGTAAAGGVFVPVNPLLKPQQVSYILRDCNVRVLVTSAQRLESLVPLLEDCHDLRAVVVIDDGAEPPETDMAPKRIAWRKLVDRPSGIPAPHRIDTDMAAILYTSGSTGNPKGVVLSHRNMVAGARSVASYLENTANDRLLAVLPFSFDYGLSQLTTAFSVGASVALMDYLLPRDILRALTRYRITGLAAVPPLWNQLVQLDWPREAADELRYITNSGGAMPRTTTERLRSALPDTRIYLMYGLTEAFRSTYLPPEQVDKRPDSMGKAIPNAEILVVREDGSECAPGEPGELVHRGSLVAMGYWNDPDKTAERFRPSPGQARELPLSEIAVWSGDQVRRDEEGYLYFISRKDDMIKTSGYRVSPTEIEEVVYGMAGVTEVAAVGLPHPTLGQAILLVVVCGADIAEETIMAHCKKELPNFMLPRRIMTADELPRNQNGKIDRKQLFQTHELLFQESES